MKAIATVLLFGMLTVSAASQSRSSNSGPNRIEIFLERYSDGSWQAVDARQVLDQNDLVRFRIRSNFSGYLYVTNWSTSGRYQMLFPAPDSGRDNRIQGGKDYVVPATSQGSFRITGPAGQEVVYWLVSPGEMDTKGLGAKAEPPGKPATLIPRCDDTILRARGECLDTSAGPKQVQDPAGLPPELAKVPGMKSRELVFLHQEKSSVVGSPAPLTGPAIYEFRLSHR